MKGQLRNLGLWMLSLVALPGTSLAAPGPGYEELQGAWQTVELVDNGRVIPTEQIPAWLPSGGRIELVDNAIVFTSPRDGKRHARSYSIDATTYPRQLNVIDQNKVSGHGIYRIDDGRLIVCLSSPADSRPTEFSAPDGSRRVLMVFARPQAAAPPSTAPVKIASATSVLNLPPPPVAPATPRPVAKPLTSTDAAKLLPGTWKLNDAYGAFYLNLDKSGVFSTYRESVETSTFQKVFRKLPLSSGTWKLNNGQVVLVCTSSVFADRLYKTFPFTIRSVSPTELEFVDYSGRIGKASRTQP